MARDVLIRLNRLSTTGKVPANAAVRFEPTVLRADADGYILDDYFDAVMVDGEATVTDLPETDLNWAYKVQVRGHGRGAGLKQVYATWYVHLPAGEGTVNFEDLPRIDPKTLTPVNDPDPAWVDAVTAVFNDSVSTAVEPAMVTAAEDETSQFRSALNAASVQAVSPRVGATRVDVVNSAATLNSAGIQAVIDAAPAGAEFYFSTEGGREITLGNAPLVPSAPGQKFVHDRALTIRQPNLYKPVYDILDRDDVTIHDLTAVGPSTRPASGTAFRDSSTANYQAAVWSNSNRTRVTGRLHATNFKIGVNLSAWDTVTQADKSKAHADNYIEDATVIGPDFGVLFYGQKGLRIGALTVRDLIDSSKGTDPLHAIYGSGSAPIRSEDVVIGSVICEGLNYGQAFQFKFTDGLQVESLLASDASGLLNLIDVHDFQIGKAMLRSSRKTASGNDAICFSAQTPICTKGSIGTMFINDTADCAGTGQLMSALMEGVSVGEVTTISHRPQERTDNQLSGLDVRIGKLVTICAGVASRAVRIGRSEYPTDRFTIDRHESTNAAMLLQTVGDVRGLNYPYSPSTHYAPTFTDNGLSIGSGNVWTYTGSPAAPAAITTKTANATLTSLESIVMANGATLINLPMASAATAGKTYTIKNIADVSLAVRVQSGGTIDGTTGPTLTKGQTGRYVFTGAEWAAI